MNQILIVITILLLFLYPFGLAIVIIWGWSLGICLHIARQESPDFLWMPFLMGILIDIFRMQKIGISSVYLLLATASFYLLHHFIDSKSIIRNSILLFVCVSVGQIFFTSNWNILGSSIGTAVGLITSYLLSNLNRIDTISLRTSSLR